MKQMREVSVTIDRTPAACWKVLTDANTFTGWVPGLRRVRIIAVDEQKRPREVQFEFMTSRTYSLVYAYGDFEMTWEPHLGRRDAVRGFARVAPEGMGAKLTYGLEEGDARTTAESIDLEAIVTSFARWMQQAR